MKATITKKDGFTCAPTGSIVVTYKQGEVVEGRAAEFALRANAAVKFDPREETKVEVVPEVKKRTRTRKKKGSE